MIFTSLTFVIFYFLFFFVYWGLRKNIKLQVSFLLFSSYVFYGWWDYRFLSLLFFSSYVDYLVGKLLYLQTNLRKRKLLLAVSLVLNLGLLFIFKYYNFFVDSFSVLLDSLSIRHSKPTLNWILPVGISFYTFQTLSYTVDIYKKKLNPTNNLIEFLSFVSFFPQLVAGPVERASKLLPQISKPKEFNYTQALDGARLIVLGFFKKIVLADLLALRVNQMFANPESLSSTEVLLSGIFFYLQLYLDFSAYTDIARGIAKTLNMELMENFKFPLFSKGIPEVWSKWHISLTTWFRDYIFLPMVKLNFSSIGWRILCTILLFTLIGFWHGANWTFILFGFFMGLSFIPNHLSKQFPVLEKTIKFLHKNFIARKFAVIFVFIYSASLTIFFRSSDVSNAFYMFRKIFAFEDVLRVDMFYLKILPCILGFIIYEYIMRDKESNVDVNAMSIYLTRPIYACMIIAILLFGNYADAPFYYFQF